MIVCVCPNPALDISYEVESLRPGQSHRIERHHVRAGGKATNTARVLAQLGDAVTLVAPLGGTSGDRFADELARSAPDVLLRTVPIAGETRSTVTVVDSCGATVLNEPGPVVSAGEWQALCAAVHELAATHVVLAGSLPVLPDGSGYRDLVRAARPASVVVDTAGTALRDALAERPELVCPNETEARELLGADLTADELARGLVRAGAVAAVVSRGPDGLVAATASTNWTARPPHPLAGNPTGAGDAANAALVRGLAARSSWPQLLRDTVATSAAAVVRPVAGEIDPALREELLRTSVVTERVDAGAHG